MLILILFISIIAITSSSTFAATVQVSSGESSNDIQSKIDSASSGDTLSFASGGSWTGTTLSINKTLKIVGNGGTITISSGSKAVFTFVTPKVGADASGSSVSDFTIDAPYAISATEVSQITLKNLKITGSRNNNPIQFTRVNTALVDSCSIGAGRYAISFNGGSGLTVMNCEISNAIDAISMAQNAKTITIKNNKFDKCDYGVFFGGGVKYVVLQSNTITNSVYHALSLTKSCSLTSIIQNTFENNPIAIYLEQGNTAHGDPTVIGSIIVQNNKFIGSTTSAVYVNTTASTLSQVATQIRGLLENTYTNNVADVLPTTFKADSAPVSFTPTTPSQIAQGNQTKKSAKLSYKNSVSTTKIKKGKNVILTTTIKNSGTAKSSKMYIKISLSKGLKLKAANYLSVFNKNKKQWTFQIAAKKIHSFKLKITSTTKGIKKVLFNVNGKKQIKSIRVV